MRAPTARAIFGILLWDNMDGWITVGSTGGKRPNKGKNRHRAVTPSPRARQHLLPPSTGQPSRKKSYVDDLAPVFGKMVDCLRGLTNRGCSCYLNAIFAGLDKTIVGERFRSLRSGYLQSIISQAFNEGELSADEKLHLQLLNSLGGGICVVGNRRRSRPTWNQRYFLAFIQCVLLDVASEL